MNAGSRTRRGPSLRCGALAFTLVELLLVIAIMGILAAITVPNLSRSMRGNRIRVATRTVVTAGRYARNISILRESNHALVFDIDGGSVYVSGEITEMPTKAVDEAAFELEETAFDKEEEESVVFSDDQAFASSGEFSRALEGVTIESVELNGDEEFVKGRVVVVFESNGRCTPYVVKLTDESGKVVIIAVDALAATETEVIE